MDVSEQEEAGKVSEEQARKDEKERKKKEGTAGTQKDPKKDKGKTHTDISDPNTGGSPQGDLNI
jgi:hypothetical protein